MSGTFGATEEIVAAVVKESTGIESWRPVRATAIMAMVGEERSATHRWMTTVEFSTFILRFFPPGTQKAARLAPELGIAKGRRRAILDGAPISKAEAFACAHYATGLPLPIVAGDTAVFATWATERFGAMRAITATLNLSREYISDRIKGYDINAKVGRVERLPDAGLIRAMDWCWRVGPFSPYGDRLPAPPFPSQGAGPCC